MNFDIGAVMKTYIIFAIFILIVLCPSFAKAVPSTSMASMGLSVEQKAVCLYFKGEVDCRNVKKVRYPKPKNMFIAVGCYGIGLGCSNYEYAYYRIRTQGCQLRLEKITYDELWTAREDDVKIEIYWNDGLFQYRADYPRSSKGFTIENPNRKKTKFEFIYFKEDSGFGREWFNCEIPK